MANRPVRQHHRVEAALAQIVDDLLHRHHRTLGGEHGFLLHAEHALDQHIAGLVGALRMDHRHVRPVRRYRRQLLAGERASHALDLGIHLRQIAADIAAEDGAGQTGGARLIGVGHGGVRMLFQFQLLRPAVFHGIAETVQRADARIAAPRKDELVDAAHADQLVVDQVRRHADQSEMFAALADDLVAGGMRNEVGEAFQRHRVAVANGGLDGFGERRNTRHTVLLPGCGPVFTAPPRTGSNGAMLRLTADFKRSSRTWSSQVRFTRPAAIDRFAQRPRTGSESDDASNYGLSLNEPRPAFDWMPRMRGA